MEQQVIPLVQRCLTYPNSAVHTMAQHMLDRWRWQLVGHMHVLTCPTYMEDHLGAVEQEINSGQVPLPQLPKHKQVLPVVQSKIEIKSACPCKILDPTQPYFTCSNRCRYCSCGSFKPRTYGLWYSIHVNA